MFYLGNISKAIFKKSPFFDIFYALHLQRSKGTRRCAISEEKDRVLCNSSVSLLWKGHASKRYDRCTTQLH